LIPADRSGLTVAAQFDPESRPNLFEIRTVREEGQIWHHVMHRPNIRERSGSATGLNARSHPAGTIVGAFVAFELSCGHAMLDAGES
jgi:hypothetical protein